MSPGLRRWVTLLSGMLFVAAGLALGWVFRTDLPGEPLIAGLLGLWVLAGVALVVVSLRGSVAVGGVELVGRSVRGTVDVALGLVLCAVGVGFLLFGEGDGGLYVGVLALVAGGSTLLFGVWDVSRDDDPDGVPE